MKFADIAGQREVINRIIQNVKDSRISHAQMIAGIEGSGNLSLAMAVAQFVNCTDKQYVDMPDGLNGDSCGQCPSCLKSHKMIHPDIHFVIPVNESKQSKKRITADYLPQWRQFIQEKTSYVTLNQWYEFIEMDKQGIISAEECNEILNTLNYKAYESEYKIVIIWMIEKLYYSAAPKILKILEEPAEKTLFLLVSDNPQKVLDTILSRVQFIKLPKLTAADIADYLYKNRSIENAEAYRLADKYDRNLTSILESLNEGDDSSEFMKQFIQWMRLCFKQNTSEILSMANEFRSIGRENQKLYLNFVLTNIRNAWAQSISGKLMHHHDSEQIDFYNNFGKYLNEVNIQLIRKELEDALYAIERNANQKILFTDVSMKIGTFLRIK